MWILVLPPRLSLGFWWAKGGPVLRPVSWHISLGLHELRFFKEGWVYLKRFACVSLLVKSIVLGWAKLQHQLTNIGTILIQSNGKNINNGQVNDEESSSTILFLLLPHFLLLILFLF